MLVWKIASKETVSIALHLNGSYADMVKSVMESGELSCDQSEMVFSYLMNGRGKIHPTFIKNDRHVELYMLCVDSDYSRPILWVKVVERSREEASILAPPSPSPPPPPPPPTVDDTSTKYDSMSGDEWDNSEDYEEEEWKEESVKMSFNYTKVKSCTKYLRVRYVDPTCRWMVPHVLSENRVGFMFTMYCMVDKENDALWGFFVEKLKAFVIDELELCVISDRHVSIANSLARYYPFAYYGVCMRHLGENLLINHHCFYSLYLYYHAAKAYTLEEFNDYFNALKERFSSAVAFLEHEVVFKKWSRAHFPGNRFNVMTSNIVESLNSMLRDEREYPVVAMFNSIEHGFREISRKRYKEVDNSKTTFIPVDEMILREKITKDDKLYVNNIIGSTDEFTVLGYDHSTKVNLSRWLCSCRKYDLVKLPCAHAMTALCLKHGDEYDTSIYNYSSQIN
ncbi:hypothetical protein FXO37_06489 [Capsicum annuum]|nr:hypothetical protein FXO37_06489 [Capsicum annuum]